jgi:multidrug efflux system membrane fusion protein
MTTNTPISDSPATADAKPKRRGFVWLIAFLVVAGVAGYAVYKAGQPGQIIVTSGGGRGGSGGRGGRGAGLGPVPVVVSKVKRSSVPNYITGLGNVTPYYSVTLKPLVGGQIMSINFQEGDLVKKDQILFVIDPRPFQVAQAQAEGQLARDQAQLKDAQLDEARYRELMKTNAIPSQTLDTQIALVGQLQGTVKTDQANIDSAKLNITYSKVAAPFDGRCGLRLVDPGNVVQANQTGLLVIEQVQPIAVLFTIPEDKLPPVLKKLRAGLKMPVEAWNRDNSVKLDTGHLQTMDNLIDTTTGTAKLKAVFDNDHEELFPSQFVNIKLLVDTLPNQIVVPSVAVQHGQQGAFVYVVNDASRVQLRPVTTGLVGDDFGTQITSGLEEGEQVVVDGTDRLQNNAQVRIRPAGGGDGGGRSGRGGGRGGSGGRGARGGADAAGDEGSAAGAGAMGGGRRGGGQAGDGGGRMGGGREGRGGRGGSGHGRGRRGGGTPE